MTTHKYILIGILLASILLAGCIQYGTQTIHVPAPTTTLTTTTTTTTSTTTTLSQDVLDRMRGITTSTSIPEWDVVVDISIVTTTTYKLKHQGNMSSNKATTTTTTSTLPKVYDYLTSPCENDSQCMLVSGCCPKPYLGGSSIAILKLYRTVWQNRLNCPLGIRCGPAPRPDYYKAICQNNTCTRIISTGEIKD